MNTRKGMFTYRKGMTYDGYDRTFFIEMTNSCRFNCTGCNILKNLDKKIEINHEDFKKIITVLDIYMKNEKYCVGLGTGDFISTVSANDLDKYLDIAVNINNDITLSIMGNYSTSIIEKEKLEILKKFYDNTTVSIVLNPLMDVENEIIFFENLRNIADIFDFRDVPLFLNLSKNYFENKETILKIKNFLDKIREIVKLDKINSLTLIFNPNKLLIQREEFQIDLKTQTEWYLEFWQKIEEVLEHITYENIFKNYLRHNDIRILPHFIDKNTNFYISLEHIGDFPLNELSGYHKIFNIKEIINLDEKHLRNEINKINKERLKVIINNKKELIKDEKCKNCGYLDFCSKQSIAINKKIYKETILGQETGEYCLGHKKLNNFIFNKFEKEIGE